MVSQEPAGAPLPYPATRAGAEASRRAEARVARRAVMAELSSVLGTRAQANTCYIHWAVHNFDHGTIFLILL